MVKTVIKRTGQEVPYNRRNIIKAIAAAEFSVYQQAPPLQEDLSFLVAAKLEQDVLQDEYYTVEEIQDAVEEMLMQYDPDVAKAFILYRNQQAEKRVSYKKASVIRDQFVPDFIHYGKYARYIPSLSRRETFKETVKRVEMMYKKKFPQYSGVINQIFDAVAEKKILPSMRSMQFAGAPLGKHNERMYNCSFMHMKRVDAFAETLYLLLCGCGVGISVQEHHVAMLPRLSHVNKHEVRHVQIPDTIAGWADALKALILSFVDGHLVEFNYSEIRPEGAPLSSGGRAPGHLPLKKLLESCRKILNGAQGRKLRPIECYDMICHAALGVLAGGIRRSSVITLFSKTDEEMLCSKTMDNFDFTTINPQRAMSNNSVVLVRHETTWQEFKEIMDLNKKCFGEPGFFFTNDKECGTNPCGEIGMRPNNGVAFCNLVEINVATCKNKNDFMNRCELASILCTLQTTFNKFPYLTKESENNIQDEPLLGVSLTGIYDNMKFVTSDRSILTDGSELVYNTNVVWSAKLGIEPAPRCTCVKPSGTASLELGCVSNGIHAQHAKKYFRRITLNPLEPVAKIIIETNPHMVETKPNGDLCVTVPIVARPGATCRADVDVFDQLSTVFAIYRNWIQYPCYKHDFTHNVSCTVELEEKDWDNVLRIVWDHRENIAAMTFLIKSNLKVPYLPMEEVDESSELMFKRMVDKFVPIDFAELKELEDTTDHASEVACSGGQCSIVDIQGSNVAGVNVIQYGDKFMRIKYTERIDNDKTKKGSVGRPR